MILGLSLLAGDIIFEVARAVALLAIIVLAIFLGAKLRKITDRKKAQKED